MTSVGLGAVPDVSSRFENLDVNPTDGVGESEPTFNYKGPALFPPEAPYSPMDRQPPASLNRQQPDGPELAVPDRPTLPDLIAYQPGPAELLNRPIGFFCDSAPSMNLSAICASPDACDCPKRDARIFTELVADVGGCLCTRNQSVAQGGGGENEKVSEEDSHGVILMVPDLIL